MIVIILSLNVNMKIINVINKRNISYTLSTGLSFIKNILSKIKIKSPGKCRGYTVIINHE